MHCSAYFTVYELIEVRQHAVCSRRFTSRHAQNVTSEITGSRVPVLVISPLYVTPNNITLRYSGRLLHALRWVNLELYDRQSYRIRIGEETVRAYFGVISIWLARTAHTSSTTKTGD